MNTLLTITAGWLTTSGVLALWIAPRLTHPDCTCGHHDTTHQHYRPGSDCALCDCNRYQPARHTTTATR